jgi:peptide/nickel transport system permease protein
MMAYIVRRLLQAALVIALVSMLVFAIMRSLPGDPIAALSGESVAGYDPQAVAAARHQLGLDQPIPVQYAHWAADALRGDLGKSATNSLPVADALRQRLKASAQLGAVALIVGIAFGLLFGIVAAVRPNSPIDVTVTLLAMSGIAVPTFVSSMALIWIFSVELHWLPANGFVNLWDDPILALKTMAMPVVALSLTIAAPIMRHTRSSVLEVLRADYIRTARSKGLKERSVVINHALRNGLLPVITVAGLRVAYLLEGTVIIESMFGIPGIGRLAVNSINARDYPTLQGIVIAFAVVTVGMNLLVDILYTRLDPAVKYS